MTSLDNLSLRDWLISNNYPSKRLTYRVEEATEAFAVFAATPTTGKVMLPLALIKEWILAFESGQIRIHQSPRGMREAIADKSAWAGQLHSFETHLSAVVHRWSTDGFSKG